VEIHIDTLVIEGLGALDRGAVERAVSAALAARLTGDPRATPGHLSHVLSALARAGHIATLDAGAIQVSPAARAEAVGDGIGRALHGALVSPSASAAPPRPRPSGAR
jgi:hypothetical protein